MPLRSKQAIAIAEELSKEGKISSEQLAEALAAHKKQNVEISDYLVKHQLITEKEFNERLAFKAGTTLVSLEDFTPDPNLIKLIKSEQATEWKIFPYQKKDGKITIAMADPFDLATLDEARKVFGAGLECVYAPRKEVEAAIFKYYGKAKKTTSSSSSSGSVEVISYESEAAPKKADNKAANTLATQVVSSVDQLLNAALNERASDIHLSPTRDGLKIRFRIDGVLEPYMILPPTMQEAILSRVKIMGGMDVAEHRITQDGRTRLRINNKEFDIRIATYPTMYGEAAAIRILNRDASINLDTLGFLPKDREAFERLIHKPHGILLVTGPTGSGKTTTLYAALQNIDRAKVHVLSVEDPIENEIVDVDQTQINVKAGLTFPTVLRAMLREDPDVIMVGEIRDKETAEISLGAAMTGHLVLSTLHTNTAIGAVARLTDLGIESYLISSTLLGVIAQRLVRKICQSCKEPVSADPELVKGLGPKGFGVRPFKGRGCTECENRGYKGRIGLYELIEVDEEFRVLLTNKAPEIRLREKASAAGFNTILEDGIEKINKGLTTVEEVIRVCGSGG